VPRTVFVETRSRTQLGRIGNLAGRVVAATALVWIVCAVCGDRWRATEAGLVVAFLHLVGVDSVERHGDQIFAVGRDGLVFSANIGQWCSSLGIVVAFAAFAGVIASGDRHRRWRAFYSGAGLIAACNLARIAATVAVGVGLGPGSLEGFHDTIATWFAVMFVLGGFALFVSGVTRSRVAERGLAQT
jgi:exosortase/archaeosortase family protein